MIMASAMPARLDGVSIVPQFSTLNIHARRYCVRLAHIALGHVVPLILQFVPVAAAHTLMPALPSLMWMVAEPSHDRRHFKNPNN